MNGEVLEKPNVIKMSWEEFCTPATSEDGRMNSRWPGCNCGSGKCDYGEPMEHPGHAENLERIREETAAKLWECSECGDKIYDEPYYVEHHKEWVHDKNRQSGGNSD